VTRAADVDLSDEQSGKVAARIREELARRRISRQRLADEARISLSTLEKALAGSRPFTLASLVRIEQALGLSLRPGEAAPSFALQGLAPDHLGAYSRMAVASLEGEYLTLRPSFETPDAVYAYRTIIAWDAAASCLAFSEAGRQDAAFTQKGQVSWPHQSGHMYLVTNFHGQFRTLTLGGPTIRGELFGLISTLQAGSGGRLTPLAAPIVLSPIGLHPDPGFGTVRPGEERFDGYRALLGRATGEGFVRLVGSGA
jgi:transcriptional regulator with XRE-family HTH domain